MSETPGRSWQALGRIPHPWGEPGNTGAPPGTTNLNLLPPHKNYLRKKGNGNVFAEILVHQTGKMIRNSEKNTLTYPEKKERGKVSERRGKSVRNNRNRKSIYLWKHNKKTGI